MQMDDDDSCNQYDNLLQEIDTLDISDGVIDALSELCYTADETGVLPFAVSHEDCRTVIALVLLAERYGSDGVPASLRM